MCSHEYECRDDIYGCVRHRRKIQERHVHVRACVCVVVKEQEVGG